MSHPFQTLGVRADLVRRPPVPIVPLAADVELAVGTVRAVLKGVASVEAHAEAPENPGDSRNGRS